MPGTRDQKSESVKDLGAKTDGVPVPKKEMVVKVEAKIAKSVAPSRVVGHLPIPQGFFTENSSLSNDSHFGKNYTPLDQTKQ
jgi:hypothetical protein